MVEFFSSFFSFQSVVRLNYLRVILLWVVGFTTLSGHVVEQIYSEWSWSEEGWQLEVQFDAGYADPETRDDPSQPVLTRKWLLDQSDEVWGALRRESEAYLKEMIRIEANGRVLDWEAEFPDWVQSPPDFPRLINGIAYFRVVLKGEEPGRMVVGVGEGTFPKLIVARDEKYLVVAPGESKELQAGGRWGVWLREGYRHVIPLGWDHVLFVFGLFFYRRQFSDLFHQSLAFTVAHSLTLAIATGGWFVLPGHWSGLLEVLIALSLVLVGLENLRSNRKLRMRLILVFCLGLLHGLGFAGALASYVDRDQLVVSVMGLNVGVELAQISLLVMAWILTLKWNEKPSYEKVRKLGSILVALAGVFWACSRILGQFS